MIKWPGRNIRKGTTLIKLAEMFPDAKAAEQWFESICRPEGRTCGHCGSSKTGKRQGASLCPADARIAEAIPAHTASLLGPASRAHPARSCAAK